MSKKCKTNINVFYERARKYLTDRYDFSENSFHNNVSKLGLKNAVPFGKFGDAVMTCNLRDIDMDELYEEYGILEVIINRLLLEW